MRLSLEFTDDPEREGFLEVTAKGEFNGREVGPSIFSYKPTSAARPAALEIATIAREMYNDLLDRLRVPS
jgi:hypothetical protein